MRVAHVIWSLGLGGAEQIVIRVAAGLDPGRFASLVCCLDEPGPFAWEAERAGVEVVALGKRGPLDVRAAGRLSRLLRQRDIRVVHTHLWGADFWGRLAARLAGTPSIVTTAHNVDSWKSWYHIAADRWLARSTTHLVAVSHEVRAFYERHGVGRGRWEVIHNGVAEAPTTEKHRGAAFQAFGIGPDEPVVAFIGRLARAKGPLAFVEAVARASLGLPSLKALIVGDGPLRSLVEERVCALGLEGRVVLTGLRQDVSALLSGVDVVAFPSEREGLSMAMLEAMAAGVPVVATEVGGTPELIEPGVTGILVPPGEPQALADGLVTLLRSPEPAGSLARAARERVRRLFSLRGMIEAYERLYAPAGAGADAERAGAPGA